MPGNAKRRNKPQIQLFISTFEVKSLVDESLVLLDSPFLIRDESSVLD